MSRAMGGNAAQQSAAPRAGVRLDVDAARAEEQECEEGGLADTLKAIVRRTMPCPRFVRYHEAHVQRYLSRLKAFPPRRA